MKCKDLAMPAQRSADYDLLLDAIIHRWSEVPGRVHRKRSKRVNQFCNRILRTNGWTVRVKV